MATSPTLRTATTPAQQPGRRRAKLSTPTLFPLSGDSHTADRCVPTPPPGLRWRRDAAKVPSGIARLAASSPLVDEKRDTKYFLLPVKSILNHCDSPRVPFRWTVNPYRGCEFGCRYCYARYTHEFMDLDAGDFERKIYVKQNTGTLAARDLACESVVGEHIAIGTATDPYQPAEKDYGATRAILEQMAAREGLSVSITTKSNQVVRDIDLLRRIAEKSSLSVNISITTLRPRLARMLEPRAPRPDLRLEAVRRLREAGIEAGVFAMPILPGLTDREEELDALARAAHDAGALWFAGAVVFLMPSALKIFLPFVQEKFPKLAQRYREWYSRSAYAPEAYRKELSARVEGLRKKYGLASRGYAPAALARSSPQLSLGLVTISPAVKEVRSCAAG